MLSSMRSVNLPLVESTVLIAAAVRLLRIVDSIGKALRRLFLAKHPPRTDPQAVDPALAQMEKRILR